MNVNIRPIAIICGLLVMTGCVAYAPPYQPYGPAVSPYGMQPGFAPYGGYGVGVAPVVPVPVPFFGFHRWGFRGFLR